MGALQLKTLHSCILVLQSINNIQMLLTLLPLTKRVLLHPNIAQTVRLKTIRLLRFPFPPLPAEIKLRQQDTIPDQARYWRHRPASGDRVVNATSQCPRGGKLCSLPWRRRGIRAATPRAMRTFRSLGQDSLAKETEVKTRIP